LSAILKTFMPSQPFPAGTEGSHCQVLVVLSGCFTYQTESGPTVTSLSNSREIHSL